MDRKLVVIFLMFVICVVFSAGYCVAQQSDVETAQDEAIVESENLQYELNMANQELEQAGEQVEKETAKSQNQALQDLEKENEQIQISHANVKYLEKKRELI